MRRQGVTSPERIDMRHILTIIMIIFLITGCVENKPNTINVNAKGPVPVLGNDEGWKIASTSLGDGKRWREIEKLNPNIDRNDLKTGQVIEIPLK